MKARNRFGLCFLDVVYACRAWALSQARSQTRQLISRTHRQNFYAAVLIIAYPTCDAERMSFTLDEPTKTDALHAAANNEATRFNPVIG